MSNNTEFYYLNKHAREFLSEGYLNPNEDAEERYFKIAHNAQKILGIEGFRTKFFNYLSRGFYSLSTPVMTNFGNQRGLPVSCFGSYIGDTMEDILHKNAEVGIMSKMGGGTSGYFGKLRARGEKISVGGESSGAVHFMQMFDTTANIVSQGSARRGSFAAYLPVEHPDIEEFLLIRDDGNPIQNMSIGITISDQWMEEMINGNEKKRGIWSKIIQKRFETGYPYLQFSDSVNNNSPKVYKDKNIRINASNLCVSGETKILTSEGIFSIGELEGEEIDVWNGKQFSKTKIFKTGTEKNLTLVIFSDGTEVYATPEHKWYITKNYNNQRNEIQTERRTSELNIGDKLIKFDLPVIFQGENMLESYTHGAYCADGFDYDGEKRMWLYGDKINIIPFLSLKLKPGKYDENTDRTGVYLNSSIAPKFYVPVNGNIRVKLEWLAGFMDCEGHVAKNQGNEALQAGSINKDFLINIQLMLQGIGVFSKVTHGCDAGFRMMPDGRGGMKEYYCQQSYRLLINSNGLLKLRDLGFLPRRLKLTDNIPQRDATQFVKVVGILENAKIADTFCCNEPLEHKIVLNGHLTGNCSEIELSSSESESFVCVLSSLNLLHWDEIKETDAIETLIYFLDSVNEEFVRKTENMKFMEAPHNFAKNQRALGMGVLGWHSLLQSKMIPFESMEAKLLNNSIFRTIKQRADQATKKLAELFGEPELLKGYGIRNVTTMAIAPTTSSSFILGQVSPSIEPENSVYYVKKLAKGNFTYKNPYLDDILTIKNQNTKEVWKTILIKGGSVQHLDFLSQNEKDVFKTFGEISQKEIVIQAAARQKYIDQSQSLNLMIPPNTNPKDVSDLLIEGWKMGVKTFYYQRSANPAQELARSILECTSCQA